MSKYWWYSVIKEVVITEKSQQIGNGAVLLVDPRLSKVALKEGIEGALNTKVSSLNIINQLGKIKKSRGRVGRTRGFKKVYVKFAGEAPSLLTGI
jgi:large subunit ribosomal protein L23